MNFFHIPTLIILGGCIFCISEKHFERADTIQIYWTSICLFLVLTVYFVCSCYNDKNIFPQKKILNTVCLIGVIEIIYSIFQLFGVVPDNFQYAFFSGSLNNPAVFGMFMSCCDLVCVYYLIKTTEKERKIWGYLTVLFAVFILLSNSRTAIISSCVGAFLILSIELVQFKAFFGKKKNVCLSIVVIVIAFLFLYLYKRDSANGRILIWIVSLDMIKERPLFGWGANGMSSHYMDFQASFLNSHPNSPFVMLADQTSNPFNEILHLSILFGVPTALLFCGIVIWAIVYVSKNVKDNKGLVLGFITLFFIWCMFSYPLKVPFVWLMLLFIFLSIYKNLTYHRSTKIIISLIVICGVCLYGLVYTAFYDFKRISLQERANVEFNNQTQKDYEELYKDLSNDASFLYNYGAMLHLYGEYKRSLEVFKDCSKYLSDYNMMLLMGDDYQQIGLLDSAIACYNRAYQMIPNRYLPLYYQMKLYKDNCNTDNAKVIAKEILRKDNKFKKSKKVQLIINEAKQCLK